MGAIEEINLAYSVQDRLKNWATACRNGWKAETCGSAEKGYKSPQVWNPPGPKLFIDHQDAEKVEKAWRVLPFKHKMILKWSYVYPVHPRMAERKARASVGSYHSAIRLAEFKIAVILAG